MVPQVIVEYNAILPQARQGFGTVHHAAFRVEDRSVLDEWTERMRSFGFSNFWLCRSLLF